MLSPIHLNDNNYQTESLSNTANDAHGFMQMETDFQLHDFNMK